MIYLLLGQDNLAKEQKIAEIKAKALPSQESLSFNYQVLYGHHLDNDSLAQALTALPVASERRVVVIRQVDELVAAQKNKIIELHKQAKNQLIIILEAESLDDKDLLTKKFGQLISTCFFSPKARYNAFDLMRVIASHRKVEALELLDELLKGGDHPLQIIAGMFWKWNNDKKQMPSQVFRKGLLAFKQADFNIKRSQLKPEYALEVLVIKLCLP